MKNRYLFRGKCADNGEWIVGNLIQLKKPTGDVGCAIQHDFVPENDVEVSHLTTKIDLATIGQCTGIKDTNGKLTFNGDLLEWWVDGEREFESTRDVIMYSDCGLFPKEYYNSDYSNFWNDADNGEVDFEIIGNIHDNPELMREGKKRCKSN